MKKIWQRISGKTHTKTLEIVDQRFRQVFLDHGVDVAQIPRLLPQIKLNDLATSEALLAALTPEVMDQTAKLFGIRRAWLEGVDEEIYEYRHCYKQPELFFEQLAVLRCNEENRFPLRVLTNTKQLDRKKQNKQMLIPVLVEKIAEIGDEVIQRYYIYCDGWDWTYEPARIQLKAMVRLVCESIATVVPLFVIDPSDFQKVQDRQQIPKKLLNRGMVTDPSMEDFTLSVNESVVAKEVDEIPAVLKYIEEHSLRILIQNLTVNAATETQRGEAKTVAEPTPEPPPQKKLRVTDAIWQTVEAAAIAIWKESGPIPGAQVAERIHAMKELGASRFTVKTVQRRIAHLAPIEIRGNPGRPKNKKSP